MPPFNPSPPKRKPPKAGAGAALLRATTEPESQQKEWMWQPDDKQLRFERLRLMFTFMLIILPSGALLSVMFAARWWATELRLPALLWALASCALHAVAYVLCRRFRASETRELAALARWEWVHVGICVALGLSWATGFVLIMPIPVEVRYFRIALAFGLIVGIIPITCLLLRSTLVFSAPLIAASIYLGMLGQRSLSFEFAAMFFLLLAGSYVLCVIYRTFMLRYLRYRLLNGRLVSELMAALEDPNAGVLRVTRGKVNYTNDTLARALGREALALRELPVVEILGAGPLSDPTWVRLQAGLLTGRPTTVTCDLPKQGGGVVRMLLRARDVADGRNKLGSVLLLTPTSDPFAWTEHTGSRNPGVDPMLFTDEAAWLKHAERQRSRSAAVEGRSAVIVLRAGNPDTAGNEAFLLAVSNVLSARLSKGDALYLSPQGIQIWLNELIPSLPLGEIKASLGQSLARQLSFSECEQSKATLGMAELPSAGQTPADALAAALEKQRRLFAF
jgi:hypothetical protein